ncbi:MAG: DUF2267 domain-containing protein [Phycisphaeraceae bacterium]|nr:DUF2267 domain-containing protein [Phycisphaeraceae bacterium]
MMFGALNATTQKTQAWLDELAEIGGFISDAQAYTALHAVLHTLRDQLTVNESAHLAAQFPMLVRGLYYEGWKPAATPVGMRSRPEFLAKVADRLGNADIKPEDACRAVFRLLDHRIAAGEVEDVRHALTHRVRELWE